MPIFEPFEVVAVPFPYVERAAVKRRPAVVVSRTDAHRRHGLLWVVMVTSRENPSWPDDVPVADLTAAGLPQPSVVRPVKITTVEAARCERRGRLDDRTAAAVTTALDALAGWR
jgi:mRNA interferase MazF